jgi:hypothetical protein
MRRVRALVVLIGCVTVLAAATPAAYADDSVSFPIDQGVEHVQQEIAGVDLLGGSTLPREQLAAQSALTYVQGRLSPAIHAAIGGAADLETAFQLQSGLCGDIVEAFMEIMQRVGVRTLPVQWFYTVDGVRQNHVAAQVWWRGRWHYVDPTWGVLFERSGSVLGPEQVARLKRPHRYAVMNNLVPWTYANARRGGGWDPLSYLTEARARQVVMNGAGTIRPPRTGATWDLSLTPDYVGTYVPYAGQLVAIRQRLTLPAGRHSLELESKGKLCGGLGVLHVGPVDVPFASVPDAGPLTVSLAAATKTVALWADGGDPAEPCAVLLAGLSAP